MRGDAFSIPQAMETDRVLETLRRCRATRSTERDRLNQKPSKFHAALQSGRPMSFNSRFDPLIAARQRHNRRSKSCERRDYSSLVRLRLRREQVGRARRVTTTLGGVVDDALCRRFLLAPFRGRAATRLALVCSRREAGLALRRGLRAPTTNLTVIAAAATRCSGSRCGTCTLRLHGTAGARR